ncbi:hypothetical protein SKAU_G00209670 [Synaphobranchus kaupii]|uniref:Integrase core domain-containing protein n=1 Tax=Synaphobranchus kaupii TaxID=118154 RepID=A0A9Q1ISS3_SYNKA|nr:hypothetical protein SKAU_G00209670 [Synaphobranchus kaupii]
MELVRPLPKSSKHQYILVILDYATRYPEAVPLHTMATKGIARKLVLLFSRVGIPEEILTIQGTPFMSKPSGLLDVDREMWEQQPSPPRMLVEHVDKMQTRMATLWTLVHTTPRDVPLGEQLSPAEKQELRELVSRNQDIFSDEPGTTDLVQHHIITEPGKKVTLRPYCIPKARREAVRAEVQYCPWEHRCPLQEDYAVVPGHPSLPVELRGGMCGSQPEEVRRLVVESRYNMVIFGRIDGFSRKIMYLDAATDNRASTAINFFMESTRVNGVPSRVCGDQGVENMDIANFMFSTRGTGRASFISGKRSNIYGVMSGLQCPASSLMCCTNWKKMDCSTSQTHSISSVFTLYSFHASKQP